MRVLIVDDEAPARARLRRLLEAIDGVDVVDEASGGAAAIDAVARSRPDALFLDVQMPEVDGFDVASSLPDDGPAVVFVTAHDHYAIRAFDEGAVDYLQKPVAPERLARTIERLRAASGRGTRLVGANPVRHLLVADRGRTHVVRTAEIEWLQAADNYVELHVAGPVRLLRRTLSTLLVDLGPGFVRTHRSAAVALAHVDAVRPRDKGDATVLMRSGAEVPCSRPYRTDLVERLRR